MNPADISRYRDALNACTAFKGLSASVLNTLLTKGLALEAKTKDVVFFESVRGGPGLYVVLNGQVEVFRATPPKGKTAKSPRSVRLNTLGPGQCFGEYSLLDSKESTASARALTNTVLFFLPRGEFMRLVANDDAAGKTIYHNLLLMLIDRLRQKGRVSKPKGKKS
jgi:CRP/FNR family cyclic AMP-dependent transcriptional regulator